MVERYLDNPFFAKSGPKSLDRNDFTLAEAEGLELADGARTLAAVSAEAILKSVEHLPLQPKLWIVGGGGRKNPHIVGDLRDGAQEGRRRGHPRRRCRAARRLHRGGGLGLSGGALAERPAADLSDDDGMQGAGERRGAGAALMQASSGAP